MTTELKWVRICQECGHKQVTKPPPSDEPVSDSYCNSKCRKCGSEALDYGSYMEVKSKK